jgi:hypothetical protein
MIEKSNPARFIGKLLHQKTPPLGILPKD